MNSGTAKQQCFYHQHIPGICWSVHLWPPLSSNGLNRPCASCTCSPSCIFNFPKLITLIHLIVFLSLNSDFIYLGEYKLKKKIEPKWSLDITGIDVWALLQEAILFLLLQQTLFLIKSGDINLASQYVALTEVTSRCLQTEGGICTWGRIICSLLFRAVKPDLLEICMWVISHSLTFFPFWTVSKLQSSNHISALQHLYVFFSKHFIDNL